jgi:hypothetical protein
MSKSSHHLLLVSLAFFIALLGSLPAYAQASNTLILCYHKTNGKLRLVNSASECKNPEVALNVPVQGPQGPRGPEGPQGERGERGIPGTGGFQGMREFKESGSYSFTVPAGVRSLMLEMWGAGGGGGGSAEANGSITIDPGPCQLGPCGPTVLPFIPAAGGGGGGGGYVRRIVAVEPGQVLTIVIGAGGQGGAQ